jgi:hypothetical protein
MSGGKHGISPVIVDPADRAAGSRPATERAFLMGLGLRGTFIRHRGSQRAAKVPEAGAGKRRVSPDV